MEHPSRRRLIAYLLVLLSAAVVVFVVLSTGDSGPDKAACKAAMKAQFDYGMSHPDGPAGKRPAACKGVSDKDVQRFASEIMQDYMNGGGS